MSALQNTILVQNTQNIAATRLHQLTIDKSQTTNTPHEDEIRRKQSIFFTYVMRRERLEHDGVTGKIYR